MERVQGNVQGLIVTTHLTRKTKSTVEGVLGVLKSFALSVIMSVGVERSGAGIVGRSVVMRLSVKDVATSHVSDVMSCVVRIVSEKLEIKCIP